MMMGEERRNRGRISSSDRDREQLTTRKVANERCHHPLL
jgi:hypothetical protein